MVMNSELLERLVHGQHLVIFGGGGDIEVLDVHSLPTAAMADGVFAPGIVDQDASHGLGCRSKEMGATIPLDFLASDQTHPCFMHQGSGLERLPGSFPRELVR